MRGLTLLKDYSGERGNYWLNREIQHQLHTKAILSIKESILVSKGPGGFQPLRKMCNYLGIGKKKVFYHTNVFTGLFLAYFQIFQTGGSIMNRMKRHEKITA